MSRTVEVKIGLAVAGDGSWKVGSTSRSARLELDSFSDAPYAAERAGTGFVGSHRQVTLTLSVEVPEPVHLKLDVPMPDEECAVRAEGGAE